jgi:hypothetical protein
MIMGAQLEAAAHKLLDFSQPTDAVLLDQTVNTFYGAPTAEEVKSASARPSYSGWRDMKDKLASA